VPMRLIPVDDIEGPDLVGSIDAGAVHALVRSIAEHGILQPLLVRRDGARYHLISGRKRLAAARSASIGRVPCLVHAVDEQEAAALARAAAVNEDAQNAPASLAAATAVAADVMRDVTESIATIQSATTLVADDRSPLVRRVALVLVGSRACRASWQLSAAGILDRTYNWRFRPTLLGTVLARVRDGFAAESRLKGIDLTLRVDDWNLTADLDEAAIVAGLCGALVAAAGWIAVDHGPQLTLTPRRTEAGPLVVEIAQDAVVPDAATLDRFFDTTWSDRPGGRAAALGAAVTRMVAERHGGNAAFIGSGRGTILRLTLGRSAIPARH